MSNSKIFFAILVSLFFFSTQLFPNPQGKRNIPGADKAGKDQGSALYAPGEVLVKFKHGVSMQQVNQIAAGKSLGVKKHFKILSKCMGYEYVLLTSFGNDAMKLEAEMRKHISVSAVSLNYRRLLNVSPNDSFYSDLWGMHNTGQTGGTLDADIDAPEAWDVSTGSSSVIVAVIDTGLDYTHPDLADNVWVNQAEYSGTAGVDDDVNGYVDDVYGIDPAGYVGSDPDTDPMDRYGHGTHCAGTIGAAGNNSRGVSGVNWNVGIMGLKFFDDMGGNGYDSCAIECIEYVVDQKVNYHQNIII